jgi:hypothetical protein
VIPVAAVARPRQAIRVPVTGAPPLSAGTIIATAGDGQVTISQGAAPTGTITSRTLYRSTVVGEPGAEVAAFTGTFPFTDSGRQNGTTLYYTLRVGDGSATADSPQTGPVTPTAASTGSTLIAKVDFEDGTSGVFTTGMQSPGSVTIVTDPTPGQVFGGGKVSRHYYKRTTPGDVNGGVYLPPALTAKSNPNGLSWGEQIYWRGTFYLPKYPYFNILNGDHDLRKLTYFQFGDWDAATDSTSHSKRSNLIINSYGRADLAGMDLGLASGHYKVGSYEQAYSGDFLGPAFMAFDQKHTLELEFKTNTNGNADGWLKLWLNGVLMRHRVDVQLVIEPEGLPDRVHWCQFLTGAQEQWNTETNMEDHRYWDDIEFRTTRP